MNTDALFEFQKNHVGEYTLEDFKKMDEMVGGKGFIFNKLDGTTHCYNLLFISEKIGGGEVE